MRVAVVAGPDPGHLLPATALAAALAQRHHRVVLATAEDWREEGDGAGLELVPLPSLTPDPRDEDMGWRLWGRAAEMSRPLAAALRPHRPDLVVADTLTIAGGFAAGLLDVPWVEVVPHWLWAPSRALPPIGLGATTARDPVRWLNHRHLRRSQLRSVAEGEAQAAAARERVGLPAEGAPALRLVATLPGLEPPRPDWPSRTFVCGPLDWEPARWPVLAPPSGHDPLVLVSDSTATSVDDSLAGRTLAGLAPGGAADGQWRIVATSHHDLPGGSGVLVGRGRHTPLVTAAACVVGAGHGLLSKALARGVPVVAVPLQGDQRETAARVERAGAGVAVPWPRATPRRLRAAVQQVLGDASFRAAAGRLADGAAGLGPERAARLVERVPRQRPGSRHRGSSAEATEDVVDPHLESG